MRLWPKSNYRRILEKLNEQSKLIMEFADTLCELEDIKDTDKEVKHKENKLITTLEAENKMLHNELMHKNRFIESLLSQMLGGMVVKPLTAAMPIVKTEPTNTMSAAERYKAMKTNGKTLPLP